MKAGRLWAIVAALVLVGAPPAAGDGPRARTDSKPYFAPAPGSGDLAGACGTEGQGCVSFISGPKETRLELEVLDDMEWPVYVSVTEFPNEGSLRFGRLVGNICTKTEAPLDINPNHMIIVWIWSGPDAELECRGPATSGVVEARFLR